MLKSTSKQLSLYSILYDKIPDDHLLKNIDKVVDFSFINKLLEGSYSKHFGRPAKEPEMMAKLLILQYLYNLSDVKVISDEKFIIQKGLSSLVDKDARVGCKSKTDSFYSYKMEFTMIPEERISTAVETCDGAYVDGNKIDELYNRSKECGINTTEVYGDKAYFRKSILDILKTENVEALIPVSASVYRIDESKFSYNKDSDQWFCVMGNHTVDKKRGKGSRGQEILKYKFDKVMCKDCPNKVECAGKNRSVKCLDVGIDTADYYEYSQRADAREFKEKYKKRASHEWRNGEMERFHGLDRARGYGLNSMSMQAKLTALAVNLKRIAALVSFVFEYLMMISGKNTQSKIIGHENLIVA